MTTTGADIMRNVGILLGDESHLRWTPAELRLWINDGLKAIVLAKPSAKSGTRVLSLAEGTHQVIEVAAGAPEPLALLNITRNLTAAVPTRIGGRAVKVTSMTAIDSIDPDWHNPARTRFNAEVRHFMYDEQNPLEFYVYPGNTGAGMVEALCAEAPLELPVGTDEADATTYTGEIGLPPTYDPVLTDYVCYRAHSKDATGADAGNGARFYQTFATALGIKIQVESASSPNARRGAP